MKYRKKDGDVTTRRISIRVSTALYKELDDKRHQLAEDWQSLGMRLWLEWLRSTSDPSENFYTRYRERHEMLDYIMEQGDKEQDHGITSNLKNFVNAIRWNPQRTPEGQREIREAYSKAKVKLDTKKNEKAG